MAEELDSQLVRLLEANGRLGVSAIAREAKAPRRQISEHLNRLLSTGKIEVRGVIHPDLLAVREIAYVRIRSTGPAHRVAEALAARQDVPFVSLVTGPSPIVAEVRSASVEEVSNAVASIRALPGVQEVETIRYTRLHRDIAGPVGTLEKTVDSIDWKIMSALERDGRLSFTDIAKQIGKSPPSARQRVLSLIEGKAIRVAAIVRHVDPPYSSVGIGVNLLGSEKEVLRQLLSNHQTVFAASTLGRFDLVLTVRVSSSKDVIRAIETLREMGAVRSAETWIHLEIVKESYSRS